MSKKQTKGVTQTPAIGQQYGGGFYAGQIKEGDKVFHLIAAPKATGEAKKPWASLETGATSATDGCGNTATLVSNGKLRHDAAIFCNDLAIGGYEDWYLPSKDELNILYAAKAAMASAGQAFVDFYYWSSTEYSSYNAWFQFFNNGNQNYFYKYDGFYVRAVRRLAI